MKIAIHQPQFMPWVGYFHKMANADLFVLLDDVQFKKNEWQHRNRIRNAQGWQWLSVPNTYKFGQTIKEVQIKHDEDWETKHVRSLTMCYAHAPFFNMYMSQFESYYQTRRDSMDTVTIDSVRLLASMMGITTAVEISSAFGFAGTSTQRLVNICRHFGASTYLAGAGGKEYMDMSLFDAAGINVEFQEFHCPVYRQHWSKNAEDFIPGLSAIDLVINCGQQSLQILMAENKR